MKIYGFIDYPSSGKLREIMLLLYFLTPNALKFRVVVILS